MDFGIPVTLILRHEHAVSMSVLGEAIYVINRLAAQAAELALERSVFRYADDATRNAIIGLVERTRDDMLWLDSIEPTVLAIPDPDSPTKKKSESRIGGIIRTIIITGGGWIVHDSAKEMEAYKRLTDILAENGDQLVDLANSEFRKALEELMRKANDDAGPGDIHITVDVEGNRLRIIVIPPARQSDITRVL